MDDSPGRPAHVPQEAWDAADVPEATDREWSRAVPFKNAHPEIHADWTRGRGRPPVEQPKVPTGFRLDADVVRSVRATGPGYDARVEKALREALEKGQLQRAGNQDRKPEADASRGRGQTPISMSGISATRPAWQP